jgi:general nucleoside transport system ATP-binding protein
MTELEPILMMQGMTKRFGRLVANDNISISLAKGEVLALLGENGAGKSTLMSILFGHYSADAGKVTVFGRVLAPGDTQAALLAGVGMVHQHFALAENLSVLDNVLIGVDPLWKLQLSSTNQRAKLIETAKAYGLEVNPEAIVSTLSMGGRQRVEILKALTRGARILILDEPTAILTPQESESLFATLQGFVAKGLSIIFISHKLKEVLRVSDRVVVLRGGKLIAERQAANASAEELAELMVGREVALLGKVGSPMSEAAQAFGFANANINANTKPVLKVRNLRGRNTERGQGIAVDHLEIRAGEIFGVAGVSGNGQTELADLLCGIGQPLSGDVELSGQPYPFGEKGCARAIMAGIARIPEDRTQRGVIGDGTLIENICIGRHRTSLFGSIKGLFNHRIRREKSAAVAQQYDIRHAGLDQPTRSLSGGNIQKLVLARELGLSPVDIQLVIANQPTWGLDVGAVAYVHEQLQTACSRGAAVLLISDELDEIFALANTVAVMYKGQLGKARAAHDWDRQSIGLAMSGAGQAHAA